MSGLWTPSGEHRPGDGTGAGTGGGGEGGVPGAPGRGPGEERELSPEELETIRRLHAELRETPVIDVLANHALGIWQLALVHLGVVTPPDDEGRTPAPDLPAAGVAIDALTALVDGLGSRFGEHEAVLREALTTAQALYVEVADASS